MLKPDITAFFDPATSTYSYVVRDPSSRACAPSSTRCSTTTRPPGAPAMPAPNA